ncbi:MAG: hypothetical protein IPH20_21010 [Bacteroidales bacterium]|nr:hypothetical protein [Bacteroidales bacterium]
MKRTISLCFLLLAGIVLLGHAVFPHHHHIEVCAFVNKDISHNHDHDYLTPFSHSHQHEGNSQTHCSLDQTVVVRSGSTRIEFRDISLSLTYGDPDSGFLISAILNDEFYQYIPVSGIFRHAEYQAQSNLRFYTFPQLRGPPVA